MLDVVKLEEELECEIETILSHLEKYEQVIFQDNLEVLGFENSLSFNYFALGIREILRNIFDTKEVCQKIQSCQWYLKYGYDIQCPSGVTTKQKLGYIICGNNDIDSVDKLINIKSIIEQLCDEYKELNKLAHMNNRPNVLNWESKAKNLIKKFAKFLTKIDKFQRKFEMILEEIHNYVNTHFETEEPNELLNMATHCYEIDIDIYDLTITDIKDKNNMILKATAKGKISSMLQWGSDSDYRHGNGMIEKCTYPIGIELDISFNNLKKKITNISIINYEIDNSSFYE